MNKYNKSDIAKIVFILNPAEVVSKWKDRFKTYHNFKNYINE